MAPEFDVSTIEGLGVVNLEELIDPFAGDRSRFIFRPDGDQSD
jgi:hypothetical protein